MDAAFFLGKIEFINPNGLVAKAYADATKTEIANLVANDPAGVVKALLAEYPTGECTSYALEANLDRVHFASSLPARTAPPPSRPGGPRVAPPSVRTAPSSCPSARRPLRPPRSPQGPR